MIEVLKRGLGGGALLAGALLVLLAAAAACGDDDDDDDADTATEEEEADGEEPEEGDGDGSVDYGSLSGSISIDGSSTVFPITQAAAEEFASAAPDVSVDVAFSGTGGGFERLCNDEIDIADASRAFEDEDCSGGIPGLTEVQVGIDALTVVVNPENDFVDCLTFEELAAIFGEDGASNWSEVRAEFPDEEIVKYFPGTDSGTFDFFVEEILGAPDEGGTPHTSDGTASEDDNVLALGVEEDQNAIGYFGFAYFQSAGESLRAIPVDNGDGACVEPTSDTALDGSYPLSRPLFVYSTEDIMTAKPEVAGFIAFMLENIALVDEVGYVSLPDDLLAEQEAKIASFLP